jgi:XTP/dITP diphosphohydrolase
MSESIIQVPKSILLATRNDGKLREFRRLFEPKGWKLFGLTEMSITREHEETGATFAENARIKALAYSFDADMPVLADDSGLEVFSLGGSPGVRSARYGGPNASDEDRNHRLLRELRETGGSRECRFVCALALAKSGSILLEAEGECRGEVAHSPRGTEGFGYDPIFLLPKEGRTYAELSADEKNLTSHRARAVEALMKKYRDRALAL